MSATRSTRARRPKAPLKIKRAPPGSLRERVSIAKSLACKSWRAGLSFVLSDDAERVSPQRPLPLERNRRLCLLPKIIRPTAQQQTHGRLRAQGSSARSLNPAPLEAAPIPGTIPTRRKQASDQTRKDFRRYCRRNLHFSSSDGSVFPHRRVRQLMLCRHDASIFQRLPVGKRGVCRLRPQEWAVARFQPYLLYE